MTCLRGESALFQRHGLNDGFKFSQDPGLSLFERAHDLLVAQPLREIPPRKDTYQVIYLQRPRLPIVWG